MGSLKERIDADLKSALLARESFRVQTLRGLKAVILDEEVARGERETGLADDLIESLVAREVKKRRESLTLYTKNGRDDLAEAEQQEIDELSRYLPEQLDEAEVQAVIDRIISELGAVDMKSMGRVIGAVKSEVGSSADGALVARLVKERLSA